MRRGTIPQQNRFERAAGKTTAWACADDCTHPDHRHGDAWWPGNELRRAEFDEPRAPARFCLPPYQPGPIAWIAALAIGLFIGWCTGAAVPLWP